MSPWVSFSGGWSVLHREPASSDGLEPHKVEAQPRAELPRKPLLHLFSPVFTANLFLSSPTLPLGNSFPQPPRKARVRSWTLLVRHSDVLGHRLCFHFRFAQASSWGLALGSRALALSYLGPGKDSCAVRNNCLTHKGELMIRLLWTWNNPTERRTNGRLTCLQALGQEAQRMQVAVWEEPGDREDPGARAWIGVGGVHCCV